MSQINNVSALTAYEKAMQIQKSYPNGEVGIMLTKNGQCKCYAILHLDDPQKPQEEYYFPFFPTFPTPELSCGIFSKETRDWNFRIVWDREISVMETELQLSLVATLGSSTALTVHDSLMHLIVARSQDV